MQQTPLNPDDVLNEDVLHFMPNGLHRIVEVGCSNGALGKRYLQANPECDYIGIEIDPVYASIAAEKCSKSICANIETMPDDQFLTLFPSDCWIFGDSLEHLYDPWAVLKRVRAHIQSDGCVVACIPNAQHWSVQANLACGRFNYVDKGLFDRTHIRWFTRQTIVQMFAGAGFRVADGCARVFNEPNIELYLPSIKNMAAAAGADVEMAINDCKALQWVVKAVPV